MVTERRLPVTLERWVVVQQLTAFSRRQSMPLFVSCKLSFRG
jgi:hypothetical protein